MHTAALSCDPGIPIVGSPSPRNSHKRDRSCKPYMIEALSAEGHLRSVAVRYIRRREPVPDLIQDTYVRLLEVAGHGRSIRSVVAFATVITSRLALDWLRQQKRSCHGLDADLQIEEPRDEGAIPEEIVEREQQIERALCALRRLPRRRREVFLLGQLYGCSHAEISVRLGISCNTIEQHVRVARQQLRDALAIPRLPDCALRKARHPT